MSVLSLFYAHIPVGSPRSVIGYQSNLRFFWFVEMSAKFSKQFSMGISMLIKFSGFYQNNVIGIKCKFMKQKVLKHQKEIQGRHDCFQKRHKPSHKLLYMCIEKIFNLIPFLIEINSHFQKKDIALQYV